MVSYFLSRNFRIFTCEESSTKRIIRWRGCPSVIIKRSTPLIIRFNFRQTTLSLWGKWHRHEAKAVLKRQPCPMHLTCKILVEEAPKNMTVLWQGSKFSSHLIKLNLCDLTWCFARMTLEPNFPCSFQWSAEKRRGTRAWVWKDDDRARG